jgi:hypothetical protein
MVYFILWFNTPHILKSTSRPKKLEKVFWYFVQTLMDDYKLVTVSFFFFSKYEKDAIVLW